jgi:hypothetical protein
MILTLDAKRRLSIPLTLAHAKPADQFDAAFDAGEDTVILRRVPKKRSWLEVLKRCPTRWMTSHRAAGNFRRSSRCAQPLKGTSVGSALGLPL